jgi:hypothetical protein
LLGIQISAKKAEEAARRSFGDALDAPGEIIPYFSQAWRAAAAAEQAAHRAVRRYSQRTVLQFIPKAAAR